MKPFRLVEQIGEGASGAIFVGEFGQLRRPAAFKILHPHLVGESAARRMMAEARALSLLDHPGIVKVFDVDMMQGRVCIVMERLVGEPLSQRLARERLSEERVVLYARQLASALEAAHAVGIVHRDLKPENVFVVPDPDVPFGERVKIIDFGIAKCAEADEDVRTATGIVLGTPTYMAPEQWDQVVDPRADIYSLGVMIYVMATGELPFSGTTDELLAEHAYCAPPRAVDIGGVSSWLSSIIERCLAKRPSERFPTMAALATALRELEQAIASPTRPTPRYAADDSQDEVTRAERRARAVKVRTTAQTLVQTGRRAKLRPITRKSGPPVDRLPRWPVALAFAVLAAVCVNRLAACGLAS
ncbi:MAG TPA: serine/threonine-protein kinase [Kofleriaceae bacterium]|nr:serine/threonine-protein kinase [Kofleriaceae bacterium]